MAPVVGAEAGGAHVLLVDDDLRLTRLVREFLEHEGFRVSVEHRGDRVIDRVLELGPDLVILDQMLPGEDGLSVLRRLRAMPWTRPILVMTARRGEVDQIVGLELGADDYVGKPASPRLLLARIRALLRRTTPGGGVERYEDGELVVERATRAVWVAGEPVDLTSAEMDLLFVLVEHAGRPVSREALFRKLRGIDYDGVDRSVDVRVSQLRRKLTVRPGGGEWIKTVRGVGYQLVRTSD